MNSKQDTGLYCNIFLGKNKEVQVYQINIPAVPKKESTYKTI